MAVLSKLEEERNVIEEMVGELEGKIKSLESDPLGDDEELAQAQQLLKNARTRLNELADKRSGRLQMSEQLLLDKEGNGLVVNSQGYAEPDLTNPDGVPPAGAVLEPDAVEQLKLETGVNAFEEAVKNAETILTGTPDASLDTASRGDYEDVVIIAASLGLDATVVANLWSRLQAKGFGTEYTKTGLFALQLLVENRYLHGALATLGSDLMNVQTRITKLHKPMETAPSTVKKKR